MIKKVDSGGHSGRDFAPVVEYLKHFRKDLSAHEH
jgi:hypothetical protein